MSTVATSIAIPLNLTENALPDYPSSLYMPALKWKRGEQNALQPLTHEQKSSMLPIAELSDRPYSWQDEEYTKSWDGHIDDTVRATVRYWGTEHEIAFDQDLGEDDRLERAGTTIWEYLFERLWTVGVEAVPVISSRASSREIDALVRVSKAFDNMRFVLRYIIEEGARSNASAIASWFRQTLARLDVDPLLVDAVFDVRFVGDADIGAEANGDIAAITAIGAVAQWRGICLLSGAFPQNLAGIMPSTHTIQRTDWRLFLTVRQHPSMKLLPLVYGDYAISHVEAFDEDPRRLRMSANLRYAHWDEWYVIKGRSVRDYGFAQYRDLCIILLSQPFCQLPSFSHGDASYDAVVNVPGTGPGNATTWRCDATNHHVHVVAHQLANLSWP